jgi:hypothetical protein
MPEETTPAARRVPSPFALAQAGPAKRGSESRIRNLECFARVGRGLKSNPLRTLRNLRTFALARAVH